MKFSEQWSESQQRSVTAMIALIRSGEIETVRFAFADQHGLVRGKTVMADQVVGLFNSGLNVVSTLLLKDSSHRTTYPVFTPNAGMAGLAHAGDFAGAGDVVLVADPDTFKVLPWVEKTGWVLCNAVTISTQGTVVPAPFCTRSLYQRSLAVLKMQGYEFVAGLEVEFYLFKLDGTTKALTDAGWPGSPPEVSLLNTGYQLLTEQRIDELHLPLNLLREHMQRLGLPLTSMEIELGPSQVEFVFAPQTGIESADAMVLFRNATKQIMRRHGYHATFMCRPNIPEVMSSGWHLHQSLRHIASEKNAFASHSEGLSELGLQYLAGLLEHAQGATVFASPTVNGYRRYRPNSLAPDRVGWGFDHRGAMLRVVGAEQATRIENRIGEPAANPYLYMASQVLSGLDGMARKLMPPPALGDSSNAYSEGIPLPKSLGEALNTLQTSEYLKQAFGQVFVDYYLHLKRYELARFDMEVTQWEHREYFDLF
jgi:glutamine synthetase